MFSIACRNANEPHSCWGPSHLPTWRNSQLPAGLLANAGVQRLGRSFTQSALGDVCVGGEDIASAVGDAFGLGEYSWPVLLTEAPGGLVNRQVLVLWPGQGLSSHR